ncbi:MAG TPA: diguanylate cyclase [Spirochaetota bacterium]|nr:diguanylate cyclase [Spirochaetota bacterium]
MSEKDSVKHDQIDRQVSSFIDEVGLYSDEHVNYIEKLNSVLEDMKNSANSTERKHYPSFYETVKSFEHYLKDKKISLTPHEKERFTVIASSGLNNMAKKRMAEDLIHDVKERHSSEIELKIEDEKKKRAIAELSKSRSFFVNWYNLFKFAMEYSTITLFTHRLKSECYDRLRINAYNWFNTVKVDIKKALDKYYFYLSVLEYNSLVVFYEMGNALEAIKSFRHAASYSKEEIYDLLGHFTSLYIIVLVNTKYIDSGLKKVFKDQKPAHGFWGFIGLLTDRPIVNGRMARYSDENIITHSLRGVLLSYYTIYAGVRVKTLYQLMYLAGEDGLIDGYEKDLTDEARKNLSERESHEKSESFRVSSRLNELSDLTGKYRELGITLSSRIFSIEAKGNLTQWNKEADARPFFRVLKIIEGLKKFIVEMITDSSNFLLIYDEKEFSDYFNSQPELIKAAIDFDDFTDELQGSREKEISGFRIEDGQVTGGFVRTLMDPNAELPRVPGARNLREMLTALSAKCFNLCMRFNDLINRYTQTGIVQSSDLTNNYDFFLNARISHPKQRGFELVVNSRDNSLKDLLEAGCSICEYISEQFLHPGIAAVYDEVAELKDEYDPEMHENDKGEILSGEGRGEHHEDVYSDRLTGIKNWAYFEDIVLPENYDETHIYRGSVKRNIFCIEISNLREINRVSGNEAGDAAYRNFSKLVVQALRESGRENIAFRGHGGVILGYISGIPALEVVDIIHEIFNSMNRAMFDNDIQVLPEPVLNAAVYTEFPGTEAHANIDTVKKIMIQSADAVAGHVAFLKNPDHVITEKDLDRRGYLNEGLISVLS